MISVVILFLSKILHESHTSTYIHLIGPWHSSITCKCLDKRLKAQVMEAVKFAEDSPFPEGDQIYTDVYKEPNYPFVEV